MAHKERGQAQRINDTRCSRTKLLKRFETIQASTERVLNLVSSLFVGAIMFFVTAEVLGRYLFNSPILGHYEITELTMPFIVFLGMGYTQANRGHIRMEFLVLRIKGRWHHITEFVTILLGLAIYAIITYYSLGHALMMMEIGDITTTCQFPTWPSRMMIALGSFVLCFRFIRQLSEHMGGTLSRNSTKE